MTNAELEWWAEQLLIMVIAACVFVKLLPLLSP